MPRTNCDTEMANLTITSIYRGGDLSVVDRFHSVETDDKTAIGTATCGEVPQSDCTVSN